MTHAAPGERRDEPRGLRASDLTDSTDQEDKRERHIVGNGK